MQITKPTFYKEFSCIAGACPDTCCAGWEIEVDETTAQGYLAEKGAFGDRLRREIGSEPGEYFFGMPEDVFVNTVFIRQLGTNEPDTSGVSAAIENILCSADETVDVKKVISTLDKVRRQLLHKNSSGGAIPELHDYAPKEKK